MLELPLVEEARRQLEICNACRYCEGICSVFPAIERRNIFDVGDMAYLANLCHDCRGCYDACPYTPPHELAVDIPRLMSEVRERTYAGYAWPRVIADRVDRSVSAAIGFSLAAVAVVVAATVAAVGIDGMFVTRVGLGSFYEVIPWLAMLIPFSLLTLVAIGIFVAGGQRFWRDSGAISSGYPGVKALVRAIWDAATLRNLDGGGPGCTYPDERPNHRRRLWHSLVFWGFVAAFVSTVSAAFYQDILGIEPPYGWFSVPVIFGSVGGTAMIIGCIGLFAEKRESRPLRLARPMRAMDIAFISSLVLINVSGMALLALRETPAMASLLAIHLGFVAALFVTLPYGKFAHSVYRFLALVRFRVELGEEERGATQA